MSSTTSVHINEALLIYPSDPTPSHHLNLSTLDSQLFLRFTIEYLLIYRSNHGSGSDKTLLTTRLKSALSRALVPYYPLAGRLRSRSDGLGLEVVCRAQGAVFVEATSDHINLSDFQQAPQYVSQWRSLLALQLADVLKGGVPPLVLQLTWLSDGSAALAVGFSHCICDGIGSAEFLNHLAELATARHAHGHGHGHGVNDFKPRPVWDRHLLDTTLIHRRQGQLISLHTSHNHPEFNSVPDLCRFTTRFSHDQLTPTSITFDKTCLDELKQLAASTPSQKVNGSQYTSFEVLSAHIWRSWARALNLPSTQILKLLFSINIRDRIKPSLPCSYYGNAIVLGCAQATVKDLTDEKGGLSFAAELIKAAKDRVDDKYVREVVESVSECAVDSVGVLILSQWSKIGLERVDFGMGRPVQVGPVCTDKYCILLPVDDQRESVKVMLAVPTIAVNKYMYLVENTCS